VGELQLVIIFGCKCILVRNPATTVFSSSCMPSLVTLLLRQQGDKDALLKALCKDPRNGRLHVLAQRVFLRWGPGLPVERSRPSLLIVLLFGKVTRAFGR
jgi:hypothetical protein